MLNEAIFRTVPELVALYALEPSVRDVYVEGSSDQFFVSRYLVQNGFDDVGVYQIGTVNIPYSDFRDLGLEDNNRSRVVFLARELERLAEQDLFHRVVCIIDADFDYLHKRTHPEALLIVTDHSSLELYAYDDVVVDKLLSVVLRRSGTDPRQILSLLRDPLMVLFIIRAVNQELGLGLEMLPIEKACQFSAKQISFDREGYVTKLLSKGARLSDRKKVLQRIEELSADLPDEPRKIIHGHDFVGLLRWYLTAKFKPRGGYDENLFYGALMGCIETIDLSTTIMFPELVRRLSALVQQ